MKPRDKKRCSVLNITTNLTLTLESIAKTPIEQAFITGGLCFAFTLVGSVLIFLGGTPRNGLYSYGMGFSAGMMLAASFMSLLLPSMEQGGLIPAVTGLLAGFTIIHFVNKLVPHEHVLKGYEGGEVFRRKLKTAWLIALAMIIHNIPEGFAVGALTYYSFIDGLLLAVAIGIQNIPEGMAVALPFKAIGTGTAHALRLVFISAIVEPIAAILAVALSMISKAIIPYTLSFAAGAMIYVVSHEVIPETHSEKREIKATVGLIIGVVIMAILEAI